jgi:hypothetical protein
MRKIEEIINDPIKTKIKLDELTKLLADTDNKNELFFQNTNLIGKSNDIEINKKQFI